MTAVPSLGTAVHKFGTAVPEFGTAVLKFDTINILSVILIISNKNTIFYFGI